MSFGPMEERHESLDLGGQGGVEISEALPNGQRLLIRRKPGVLVFDKVPLGARVNVRTERRASLLQVPSPGESLPGPPSLATVIVVAFAGLGGDTLTITPAGSGPVVLTEGVDWTAATDNETTAASLAAAVLASGITGITAVVAGTAVLIGGVPLVSVVSSDTTNLTVSLPVGSFLPGGRLVQGYRFELAPRPPERLFDLIAHFNVVGGGPPYSITAGTPSGGIGGGRSAGGLRTLHVTPGTPGRFVTRIDVPAYAPFAAPVEGELVNMGKLVHQIVMPGPLAAPGPVIHREQDRRILRMRFQAAAANRAVGDDVITGLAGATRIASAVWGDSGTDGIFTNLVPGSIVMTLPTGASFVVNDDGFGNLFGVDGSGNVALGVVDYVSGAFILVSDTAQTGDITADFGHSIDYAPINVFLEWDALVPQ